MGAGDGIVSTAGLIVGVVAADLRVVIGGTLAMGISAVIGRLLGTVV